MKLFRGAKGKIVRRFGINIFDTLKYDKVLERRPAPPGQHGVKRKRAKLSEYGKQLTEKQKLKFAYGLSEKQFRNTYKKASNMKGAPGVNLMQMLERRLDSIVFRSGMASSRPQARQMVNHGHFLINQKPANIPSIQIKAGDKISAVNKVKITKLVEECIAKNASRNPMPWLQTDTTKKETVFLRIPERAEIPVLIQEQLIVELYSR